MLDGRHDAAHHCRPKSRLRRRHEIFPEGLDLPSPKVAPGSISPIPNAPSVPQQKRRIDIEFAIYRKPIIAGYSEDGLHEHLSAYHDSVLRYCRCDLCRLGLIEKAQIQ